MKEYLLPAVNCLGKTLAETLFLGSKKYPKGFEIDAAMIETANEAAVPFLPVIEAEADEYTESQVVEYLKPHFEKEAMYFKTMAAGKALLLAKTGGLFCYNSRALHAFNAKKSGLFVSALPSDSLVKQNDLLAVFKVVPFAVKKKALQTVLASQLSLRLFTEAHTTLNLLICEQKNKHAKILAAVNQRLARLGMTIEKHFCTEPSEAAFEIMLKKVFEAKASFLMVLPSSPLSLENRWLKQLEKQGVQWMQMGIPIEAGHMTVIGKLNAELTVQMAKNHKIIQAIVLPGCTKLSAKPNGLDKVLQRLKVGADLDSETCLQWGIQHFE